MMHVLCCIRSAEENKLYSEFKPSLILAEKEITFVQTVRSQGPEPICPLTFLCDDIFFRV